MTDAIPVPRVTFVNHQGERLVVEAVVGESVMRTAKRQGIPGIRGDCGGFMQCATCHVYVDESDRAVLPPMSEVEDEMLDGTVCDREAGSRLSCQLPVGPDTDLHVRLPERQL